MALVFGGVCRYTIEGTILGAPCANVLDIAIDTAGGSGTARQDGVEAVAERLVDIWPNNVLSTSYSFDAVSWVDLDSQDGVTGSVTASATNNLPQDGGHGGDPYTAAVAILINKVTTARRGQRQGRMFVPGLVELDVSGNFIIPAWRTTLGDSFDLFLEQLEAVDTTFTFAPKLVVVHTRNTGTPANPVIVADGTSEVTALAVNARVSTQRRRNR